jgi:TonB family protein
MDTQEHFIDKEKLDSLFVENRNIKQWIKDNQVGIYTAIIFHLLVFLALALNEIRTRNKQSVFVEIVFQKDIKKEPEKNPAEEKKIIEEELKKMLKEMPTPDIKLPNLTMNAAAQGSESGRGQGAATASFFSSRNTSTIREEKEREREKENQQQEKKNRGTDDVKLAEAAHDGEESQAYKGPSIVSYYLEGRVGISIPVPSYKCFNGGDVTVLIEVNRLGYVVGAEIDKKNSSNDECLHRAAKEAAERARFSSSQGSEEIQKGNIVYRFVSQ